MPTQMGPIPEQGQPGATGPTGPTAPPSPQGLLGEGAASAVTPSPTSPEQQSEALMAQFRDLSSQIQSIARQYPAAAQDLAVCNDSLINAMTKVLSGMSAEPQSAPPVLM
jgi:hypothetical protein